MNKQPKFQGASDVNDGLARTDSDSEAEKVKKLKAELASLERLEREERRRAEKLKTELDSLEYLELEEEKKAAKLVSEVDSLELKKKKKLEEQNENLEFGDHNEKEVECAKRRRYDWLGF